LLWEAEGNVSAVARRLTVCTRTVYRWLKAMNLDLDQIRAHLPQSSANQVGWKNQGKGGD
jgi:transposase-like protein